MDDARNLRFERWWTRAVAIGVAALSIWFVASEWSGLARLGAWLWAGIADAPAALVNIVVYYTALPLVQLAPSLIIGALVGAAATGWVLRGRAPADIVVGGAIGLVSGQVLTVTMQHCTYEATAPFAQAVLGAVLTAVSAVFLLIPYWTLRRGRSLVIGTGVFKLPLLAIGFLAPTLISLGIFLYYPSVQTLTLSLNLRRFPLPQERFVCLANYVALTQDLPYQTSVFVTMGITIAIVLLSLSLSLGIAVLASQKIRGASIYRTLLIWPFALSPVVTGVIFLALFRDGASGLINYTLTLIGLPGVSWLRDPNAARWVIIMASVWNILGFNILFYIAGLQNVPKDLLEAAQIDGANTVQRFFRVTFPLLSPFTFFLLVTNVTYSFYGIYGVVDALTRGGPPIGPAGQFGGATNVMIYKLYADAFTPGSPAGLAAAQAVILFLFVAGLTVVQFRVVERRVTYGD